MKRLSVKYLVIVSLLVSSLLLGVGCAVTTEEATENVTSPVTESVTSDENELPVTTPVVQSPALPSIADVVASVKPSVVAIETEITTTDFFNRQTTQESAGSGWIISQDGYIVTNNHVVEGAVTITAVLDDGRVFPAEIIGTDSLTDLAVIKIEAEGLPAAKVGDSSLMRVGDWVVAMGNSLGQGTAATQGIISRTGVSLQVSTNQFLYGLVETDAAINEGNSGGPLVNMSGEVIGINSYKTVQVSVEGVGYSISTEEALPVIEQLINTGEASHPWLGVSLYTVDQYVIETFNLTIDSGAFVVEVVSDSPAGKAGVQAKDVITGFAGNTIETTEDLVIAIRSAAIGEEVEIVYWRDGAEHTTHATLIKRPDDS